ncbi:unnamed protein product [Boreogadus saida]
MAANAPSRYCLFQHGSGCLGPARLQSECTHFGVKPKSPFGGWEAPQPLDCPTIELGQTPQQAKLIPSLQGFCGEALCRGFVNSYFNKSHHSLQASACESVLSCWATKHYSPRRLKGEL